MLYFCRVDQGYFVSGSGALDHLDSAFEIWIPRLGLTKRRVHSGMLLGPEDFASHEKGHSLNKAEQVQGGVSSSSDLRASGKEMHWETNASWLPI